jgi:hypothetical protein
MVATGWQTAPPQLIEVVSATKSAVWQSLEVFSRVTALQGFIPFRSSRSVFMFRPRPAVAVTGVLHAACASPALSAPTVSSTHRLINSFDSSKAQLSIYL